MGFIVEAVIKITKFMTQYYFPQVFSPVGFSHKDTITRALNFAWCEPKQTIEQTLSLALIETLWHSGDFTVIS